MNGSTRPAEVYVVSCSQYLLRPEERGNGSVCATDTRDFTVTLLYTKVVFVC